MDLQMPVMGGLEATQLIRQLEEVRGTKTPIIALTAHAMQGDRERCLEAGMDGYVSKPIRREELRDEIERVLEGSPVHPVTAESDIRPVASGTATPNHVEEPIRRRFPGDDDLLRQLAVVFLEDYPERVAAIADALDRGQSDALARAAHTLKGSVSVLSENGPTLVVRQLEAAARAGDLAGAAALYVDLERQMERLKENLTDLVAAGTPTAEIL
jgi:DNA-binding NarL/FixJ family response regulator